MTNFLNNVLALSTRDINNKISDVTLERAWTAMMELEGSNARARKQFCRLDAAMRARNLID